MTAAYLFVPVSHETQNAYMLVLYFLRHSWPRTGRDRLKFIPYFGRPGIVTIRIRHGVVRIQDPRRTIAIISIAAKTRSRLPVRYFNLPSRFQRFRSLCRTCPGTEGFSCLLTGACSPLYSACGGAAPYIKTWADPAAARVALDTVLCAAKNRGEQEPK